jgi:hypothetical protein
VAVNCGVDRGLSVVVSFPGVRYDLGQIMDGHPHETLVARDSLLWLVSDGARCHANRLNLDKVKRLRMDALAVGI